MTTQDIFKAFGSNWKWASISSTGDAWVHSIDPVLSNGGLIGDGDRFRGLKTSMHCGAFDTLLTPEGKAYSWERTDFSNGPNCETDKFGSPLPAPVPQMHAGAAYCPPQVSPAEAGKPYVDEFDAQPAALTPQPMCNVFNCLEFALPGDLCCKGHTTYHSKLAVPPMQPRVDYQPANPGLREDEFDAQPVDVSGQALDKAKKQAWYLVVEGHLTSLQYVAIFGELPQ
jgi:hypothetical protein